MAICKSCGAYYRVTPYNSTSICDTCYNHAEELYPSEDDLKKDIDDVVHKDGCYTVKPVFYD